LQGVNINDKHIETISRQMMRWVKVEDVATPPSSSRNRWTSSASVKRTDRVIAQDGRPATGRPLLLGITKASLSTDSFNLGRQLSRRPPASSRKPPLPVRSTISAASRKTSSWAGSFLRYRSRTLPQHPVAHRNARPCARRRSSRSGRICRCGRSRWLDFLGRHQGSRRRHRGPGLIGLGEFSPRISQLTNGASVSPAAPFFCLAMIATFSAFPFTS